MPQTPDRKPGVLQVDSDGIDFDSTGGTAPTVNGEYRYVAGVGFRWMDDGTVKGLGGLSETEHKTLRQLIHLSAEDGPWEGFASGAYEETLPAANAFPTSVIWWVSAAKLEKIVEESISYNSNKTIATDEWKVYAVGGALITTITDTYSYSGVFVLSRTRVIT
jgi:hypothetical protein